MAVIYPISDVTRTTTSTPGYTIASTDVVFIKNDIEVAALGTGDSPGLTGTNVVGAQITIAGTLLSAYDFAIELERGAGSLDGSRNNTILVAEGGLVAGKSGLHLDGNSNSVTVDGSISALGPAALFDMGHAGAANSSLLVNNGSITGHVIGIGTAEDNLLVRNHGILTGGGSWGVLADEVALDLVNTGTLSSAGGNGAVTIYDHKAFIANSGMISSGIGIWAELFSGSPNQTFTLVNSGVIDSQGTAMIVRSSSTPSRYTSSIENSGTIRGTVELDEGHDLYNGTLGVVTGRLDAGGGNDTLLGGAQGEHLNGGSGNDELAGGGGADTLQGSHDDDEIEGGSGDDLIEGGTGADVMDGGEGLDTLSYATSSAGVLVNMALGDAFGGDATGDIFTGFERLLGSAHADTLRGSAASDSINGGAGDDEIAGDAGNDHLRGGAGNDSMDGGAANDVLRGGDGNDELLGGAGSDHLRGDAGMDTLDGGAGYDRLFGGLGEDVFRFRSAADTPNAAGSRDRVMDFSQAQGDKVDLSLIDAVAGGANDSFAFIGGAEFGGVAGQLRFAALGTDTLLLGDVNGDSVADFGIQFRGAISFVEADIVL